MSARSARPMLLLAGLLLLAGCGSERVAEVPGEPPAAVSGVRVATVTPAAIRDAVEVAGTVRTRTQMVIASKVQGYVREVRAREKQMSYRIDAGAAELRAAELALGETRITAPATGVVVDRRVEPGDLAMPGQPLLVLDDPRAYRLEAEVGESAVGRVRVGQRVPVVLDSLGRTLEGRVVEIIPASDPSSRTVTVKLDLPVDPGLRSGLFGRARFPAGERQVLVVPSSALVERGQLTAVYVVDDQAIARLRLVTAGGRHADRVEILSGLDAGERVVVEGASRVSDGSRVAAGP